MKSLKWVLLSLGIVLMAILVAIGSRLLVASAPAEIKYTDLVVIILTSLSIMITVLGLGIAVLAVVGWATFESKLRDNSFSYFATQLGKDGPLRRELEALLIEISLKGIEKAEVDSVTVQEDEKEYKDE